MLEYTKAGEAANLAMILLHESQCQDRDRSLGEPSEAARSGKLLKLNEPTREGDGS